MKEKKLYGFSMLSKKLCLFFLVLMPLLTLAQEGKIIRVSFNNATIEKVFSEISQKAGVRFAYDANKVNVTKTISLPVADYKLEELLNKVCSQAGLSYQLKNNIVTVKAASLNETGEAGVVSGIITNEAGDPLPSVTISNPKLKTTVVSKADGSFTIPANLHNEIVFSSVGFVNKTVQVNSFNQSIRVALSSQESKLAEVVVTSLGIKREKRALSYAVGEVKGESIVKAREPNVINSLQGRVAGLIITNTAGGPTGSSKVLIRGNTDITGNNQPLYVIDGVPMDNSNYGGAGSGKYASGFDKGDAISAIDPNDVESVSVLKGPAAAALYGGRAGHGAILITTKKGSNRNNLGIEVNSTATLETLLSRNSDYQYEYGQGRGGTIPTDLVSAKSSLFVNFGAKLDPNLVIPSFNGGTATYGLVKNNIENFFRTGTTSANNISLTGGSETGTIRFSYSNLYNNDIVPKSNMSRHSFTLRGTSKLGSKLNLDARITYTKEHVKNRAALAGDDSNIGFNFVGLANNVDQKVFETGYQDAYGNYIEWGGGQYQLNPYWVINRMRNITDKDRIISGLQLNYEPAKWLTLQGRLSNDFTYLNFEEYRPRTTPGTLTGRLSGTNSRLSFTSADALITAKKSIGSLDGSVSAGGSLEFYNNSGSEKTGIDMVVTDAISFSSFKNNTISDYNIRKRNNSFYTMLNLGYKNFLYLDATMRRDISSTLPVQNNSYWYPSLGGSFIISDAFKIKSKFLSYAKIRASAAEVGNDTDPYQLDLYYKLELLQPVNTTIGDILNASVPNAKLKPTRTRSFEIGTDLRFFDSRIVFEGTYYTQSSRDQINRIDIPFSGGFETQIINSGTVQNTGVELMLSGKAVAKKNFSWDISINAAHNKNTVKTLAAGVSYITLSDARWMGVSVVAQPGLPFGTILSYDYERSPSGDIILDSLTLLPIATDYRKPVGKGTWDWTGGLTNSFRYKNFTLTAVIDVKTGADLFSMTNLFSVSRGQSKVTVPGRKEWIQSEEERQAAGMTLEDWVASGSAKGYIPPGVIQTGTDNNGKPIFTPNTRAIDPNLYWPSFYGDDKGIATPFIYDASYVKMREIIIGYRLPDRISKKIKAQSLSISVVSRNPFIIHKNVPNVDPDSNYNNGNGQGFEYGSLPSRRSWGVNLNLRF